MTTYDKGAVAEIETTFTNTATGALVDPTTVRLIVRAPDGTLTTYTYPTAEIVRDSIGAYRGLVTTTDDGEWRYRWETVGPTGARQGEFYVRPSIVDADPTVTVTYATVQELRDEMQVDDESLTDYEAKRLILAAEDLIDAELGARIVDDTTGRKVVPADEETYAVAKLKQATLLVAAGLYRDPTALTATQYRSVTGPDFRFDGRIGGPLSAAFSPRAQSLLDASGLRRLTTTTTGRRDRPPWWSFSYNTDPDGPDV